MKVRCKNFYFIFTLFAINCNLPRILPEFYLNPVTIQATAFKASYDIKTEPDSVRAVAMLLNRECPTCSFEEKIYVASCVVTGSRSINVHWKTYLFEKGQFWSFDDKRIQFNPKKSRHRENLLAAEKAWKNPKKVRFYATKIDGDHYNQVKKKGIKPRGFYQYYSYYL
jgi:hypothetical protein